MFDICDSAWPIVRKAKKLIEMQHVNTDIEPNIHEEKKNRKYL